MEKIDGKMT